MAQQLPQRTLKSGDTGHGVAGLAAFLRQYGYLTPTMIDQPAATDALQPLQFDDDMIEAMQRYQEAFGLTVTFELSEETLGHMQLPRCGVPDQFGAAAGMRSLRLARWDVTALTYRFANLTPQLTADQIFEAGSIACATWSDVTPLTFSQVTSGGHVRIGWFARRHAGVPDIPFDGQGGQLGHAWGPGDAWRGELHLDGDEAWSIDTPASGSADLVTQLVHELGHVLGLDHSRDQAAIMYPTFRNGEVKRALGASDIDAIQLLYGP
jgi:hypothetical protein